VHPVIVASERLAELAGRVTLVDGGFDPLHPGHVAYFRAAAALGLPVLCNVSGDDWVARKHPPLLTQAQRCELIDAIRHVDYTHASSTSTAEVLSLARPKLYAKGADWRGRLPDEELATCEREGIEVVYLDTVLDSSTDVLRRYLDSAT
jgi:glycerol-3-phosphate cytidylyltransferase-like family protein